MSHGGLKRARSWKRRIQPKEAYSSPGLLYSEAGENSLVTVTMTQFRPRHADLLNSRDLRLSKED
jgi:hypothetical protein